MEFVNRVLALQSNSPITKFSLVCHKGVDEYLVDDWLLKALRRGVSDLTLILLFPWSLRKHSPLPPSIFSYGQNLIKLRIGGGNLAFFNYGLFQGDFIFPNLRILHLNSINLGRNNSGTNGDQFALLLSKCIVLEELIINCIKWHGWSSASVSSPTLKRLTIDGEQYIPSMDDNIFKAGTKHWSSESGGSGVPYTLVSYFGISSPRNISFDTPNLLHLNYSDFVARNYPLDVGSTLSHLQVQEREPELRDATNLIMGIQNVQTLHLTSDTIEVIADFCKTEPIFHNLKHLSIESDSERRWQGLPILLINCSSLQTLVFHGLHHRVTDGCGDACNCISPLSSSSSSLSSCPVKILKILDFGATCGEMSLVEHFLKHLRQLEQMIIILHSDSFLEEDCDPFEVSKALDMAPRASPNCKLTVVNESLGSQ
ncbi:F-box/LRR-repeat protein [Cardamine amara subsp. amara]|uniref:F-box/LRR-repeat protein n=1 Tax=Cardamine amara subsp. amara TaxID=228776 RepID=A0ABD1BY10_CARAN